MIDKLKAIADIAHKLKNVELLNAIADLQLDLIAAKEREQQLRDEVLDLKGQRDFAVRLGPDDCYHLTEPGDRPQGPYCTRCYDVDRKLVLMGHKTDDAWNRCTNCKTTIEARPASRKYPKQGRGIDNRRRGRMFPGQGSV